ncbi:hypothetical protein FPQ18DRAFT_308465 [Pyronema domesticum]|nr:hypothetical protein FPQ18DRAFT_308465 [Pyronema domesticum]
MSQDTAPPTDVSNMPDTKKPLQHTAEDYCSMNTYLELIRDQRMQFCTILNDVENFLLAERDEPSLQQAQKIEYYRQEIRNLFRKANGLVDMMNRDKKPDPMMDDAMEILVREMGFVENTFNSQLDFYLQ